MWENILAGIRTCLYIFAPPIFYATLVAKMLVPHAGCANLAVSQSDIVRSSWANEAADAFLAVASTTKDD